MDLEQLGSHQNTNDNTLNEKKISSVIDNYENIGRIKITANNKINLVKDSRTNNLFILKRINLNEAKNTFRSNNTVSFNIIDESVIDSNEQKLFEENINRLNSEQCQEAKILQNLRHKNIAEFHSYCENGVKNKKDGRTQKNIHYVVNEFFPYDSLQNLINFNKIDQDTCRYLVINLINGLDYLHSNKIAHLDINPGNQYLDKDMNLKLNNFTCSKWLGSQDYLIKQGSQQYLAPELQNYKNTVQYDYIDLEKVDVFACGVSIFNILTGSFPFQLAYANKRGNIHHDPYYYLISKKNYKKYWDEIEKNLGRSNRNFDKSILSEDFKDLFINMVAFDVKERLTIPQIKEHNWFKNNTSQYSESRIKKQLSEILDNDKSYIEQIENQAKLAKVKAYNIQSEILEKANKVSFNDDNFDIDKIDYLKSMSDNSSNKPQIYKSWKIVLDQISDKKIEDHLIHVEPDQLLDIGVRCESLKEVFKFYKNFIKICEANLEWVCSKIRNFKVLVKPDELFIFKKRENLHQELEIMLSCEDSGKLGSEFVLVEGPVHEFYILQSMLQQELSKVEA